MAYFWRLYNYFLGKLVILFKIEIDYNDCTTKFLLFFYLITFKQNTVRLIVRLTHQRQSILRVNPNEPLQHIFDTVIKKLHLKAVNNLEFRHPLHGLNNCLDMKKSLNDYNIRDVFLLEKLGCISFLLVSIKRSIY